MPPKVLLFFVDGFGLPAKSPFVYTRLLGLEARHLPGEVPYQGIGVAADAQLGVPGLPQSATGQTALFTGVNAPAIMGRHVSGLPGPTLKKLIERKGLFSRLRKRGLETPHMCFANAFRPSFFEKDQPRTSVSTHHAQAGGVPLKTLQDLSQGKALYHDFTNSLLINKDTSLPLLSPEAAGMILASITQSHISTVYEFFLTDLVGHSRLNGTPLQVIKALDIMLCSLLEHLSLEDETVILASDHGNVEDTQRTIHTFNPVPVIVWGRGKEKVLSVKTIQDVPWMVEDLIGDHLTAMPTSDMSAPLQSPITRTTSP
jgi:2,3-bisphosphoglycerate-independent phosphoglycerate mutase